MQVKRSISLLFLLISTLALAIAGVALAQGNPNGTSEITAACAGGPVIDGIPLDECYIRHFSVGGITKSVTIWYTNNPVTATRIVDGNPKVLEHWINTDAEAVQVGAWFEEAWKRYYTDSSHHLYDTGCGNNVNVRMEDGVGWSGIAYWASSGNCSIGIDSPTVRNGGGQRTVYHEAQHYLQYSYDSGCYGFLKPNYSDDAEFVEGYADLGSDSVNAAIDAGFNDGNTYDPLVSMYDKGYRNRFNKYFIEQLGSYATPSDPWHNIDAMYAHYTECDNQNTLYVLDTLVPTLSGGELSKKELFLNFFAANWARDWADPILQPELVYWDDDTNPYNDPTFTQNVSMAGGSQTWADSTPDNWAARYYQINPLAGCDYVQLEVNGASGANLGINLMAADTAGTTSVLRSAWIGEDFVRTFAGNGVYNKLVAVVNSFSHNYNYDVTATCVSPTVNILEPKQTSFAMVGDPVAPIAFLARFEVTSGGAPVRGLVESSFTFDAGGDAITVVPGTLQEVGQEYWAVLMPPVKSAGTSFVNFKVCVDANCDTETNALLYVNPGNTNTALVFDASGSMGPPEDIVGEGTRVDNAKRAGDVVADLLRDNDRILVLDFSAKNIPVNCGLPGGAGDCTLDIKTLLPRTNVSVAGGTIATVHTAIGNVSARAWTPIGAALVEAQDQLLATPTNDNPNYIYLLSDGEENVNPLYAAKSAALISSGVVINTIGFGPEAPGALLAQIAAQTGGTYRPVPTTAGGTPRINAPTHQEQIAALNLPEPFATSLALATTVMPGQLALADVYDDFDTQAQDAARVSHATYTAATISTWKTQTAMVDESATVLRFVSVGKQPDLVGTACGYHREVEVLLPGASQKEWIPISPKNPVTPTPANWDIRNSTYDDTLIVTNPVTGTWNFRTMYWYEFCREGQPTSPAPTQITASTADFMMNMSLQSTIRLDGRLLNLTDNQGDAGDVVPIVATLLQRTGTITGALVIAAVEKPGGTDYLWLRDDGGPFDGNAGDGIYGAPYALTSVGGSYGVRIVAFFYDPANGTDILMREWNGGFWIQGPAYLVNDPDGDGMPTDWELRCKLDPTKYDAQDDMDDDGLTNIQEFEHGTLPCQPDTDHGGERDGSEVNGGRNPLWGKDDVVPPQGHITVRPLNGLILVRWSNPFSYTGMNLYLLNSLTQTPLPKPINMGRTGVYSIANVTNDQPYYLRFAGLGLDGTSEGAFSDPFTVTPKSDPDPPSGSILIGNGVSIITDTQVTLYLSSTDVPLAGAAEGANGHLTDQLSLAINTVSGNVEMRISNDPSMQGATWEPLAAEKPWTMQCGVANYCTVYAQFRDGAGNESLIISDQVYLQLSYIYLPLILK